MDTIQEWFYQKNHQQYGPLDTKAMIVLLRDKAISPATLVWTASFNQEWKPLSETELLTLAQNYTMQPTQKWKIGVATVIGLGAVLAALFMVIPQQPTTLPQQKTTPDLAAHTQEPSPTSASTSPLADLQCDSSQIVTEVTRLFNALPMNRLIEKTVLHLDKITQLTRSAKILSCQTNIEATDATTNVVSYSIQPFMSESSALPSNQYSVTIHLEESVPIPNKQPQLLTIDQDTPPTTKPQAASPKDDADSMDLMYAGLDLQKTEKTLIRPTDIEYLGAKGHYLVVLRPLGAGKYMGHVSVDYAQGSGDVTGPASINKHSVTITQPASSPNPKYPNPECSVTFLRKKNTLVFKNASTGCTFYHGASVGFESINGALVRKHHS